MKTINSIIDSSFRDTKLFCQLILRGVFCGILSSNVLNDFPRNERIWIFVSLKSSVSSLCHHIYDIFSKCTEPQMIWISAWRIVALVKNIHAVWYWSSVQNPRSSVGQNFYCSFCSKGSITKGIASFIPFPAQPKFWTMPRRFSILRNLLPKTVGKCFGKSLRGEILGSNFYLHSISLFDCLPRLRLFMQRAGNFIYGKSISLTVN